MDSKPNASKLTGLKSVCEMVTHLGLTKLRLQGRCTGELGRTPRTGPRTAATQTAT